MSTHPITRKMTKALREGATVSLKNGELETTFARNRIAACMILGDSYDKEFLTRCVTSLKNCGIDKLFIAYNGKTRRSLGWLFEVLKNLQLPFVIQKFAWEDDFALARNQSFDMVPKEEFDWMMWIDSDDEFVVEYPDDWDDNNPLNEKIRLTEILEDMDKYSVGAYLRYDYTVDPKTGAVVVQQWRERILSTKVDWQWVHPVHEVVFSPAQSQYARPHGVFVRHLRDAREKDDAARARNRRIIAKALRLNPEDTRMQMYFANELMAEADDTQDQIERNRLAELGIMAFKRFLSNSVIQLDDRYLAATRLGELHLMRNDVDQAIDAFLNSIKIIPDWPDAYIGLARACMEAEDWERCRKFCNLALSLDSPDSFAAQTPLTHRYTPLLLRGMANEGLNLYEEAEKDYRAARDIWSPENGMLDEKIQKIEHKLAVTPADKDERRQLRGKRPEKSIAFVTSPLLETWHPETEKVSGAGGAETCIMRLAPRFAADGWRVVVFGTPGEHRGVDENGVEWWNSEEYLPNEEFKVLVASRMPEVFEVDTDAFKVLWMHDVNVGQRLYPFIERTDRIVGLTNWHVNHMQKLYGIPTKKLEVIPNGIELGLFDWDKKMDHDGNLRFIWSSSPDRGLETMIALWPEIRARYPDSRLDIFYGWNLIDKIIRLRKNAYLGQMRDKISNNISLLGENEGGIYQHGRIPQSELAQWQLNAHIWPYPTDFMETFCITAIEMQAAGAIPIASRLAALPEVVANDELLIEGWPLNKDYQTRWLRKLDEIVEASDERLTELQLSGKAFAEGFSWDSSYVAWQDFLGRTNGR